MENENRNADYAETADFRRFDPCESVTIRVNPCPYRQNRAEKRVMLHLEQIQTEIELLAETDFVRLRNWFAQKDWERCDRQLAADVAAGKLDFLRQEALAAKTQGNLQDI